MRLSKKKILFIITHLELGGAQKQLLSIIKGLGYDGYSLYLFAGNQGYLKQEFINIPGLNIKLINELTRKIHPLYDFIAFFKLYFYIRKNHFDIVHTHSPKASIVGRWAAHLAGTKEIIYTVHGWSFHRFMNLFVYHLYLFLEKVTAKITRKIIVVSRADLAIGIENKISEPSKFSLIHYGVNIDKFDKVYKERKNIFLPYTILTVSSFKPQKGIHYFLRMAETLLGKNPELNFVIAGDGPLRKKIERKIESMGLKQKISLLGWVGEIDELLKKSSLFVLTSLWEGLPVSLIEAVISGLPVVATDTGGVSDIIQPNKHGFLVNPADATGIEESCWNILKDYKNWSKIIDNNRENLDRYYWSTERMLKEMRRLYR